MRSLLPCSTASTTKRRNAASCGERVNSWLTNMRSRVVRTSCGLGRSLSAGSHRAGIAASYVATVANTTIAFRQAPPLPLKRVAEPLWLAAQAFSFQRPADLFKDRRVVDGRRHCPGLVVGDLLHGAAQDLAGTRLWQAVHR